MRHTATCPDTGVLRQFLLGRLPGPQAQQLERHLEHCSHCLGAVSLLDTEDAVVEAMRGQAALDEPESDVVEGLLHRVGRLQPQPAADEPTPSLGRTGPPHQGGVPPTSPAAGWSTRTGDGTDPPAAPPPSGRNALDVPGYEVLDELGRGGMGVVYLARQTSLNRLVALKMILSGAHAGPAELARFKAEAEAAARLRHPHIIQIYEVGQHEGRPYMALEYVEGGSLDRKVKGRPQDPRASARLVQTLARAVHHAHTQGIVHRDLKPANVLLVGGDGAAADEAADTASHVPLAFHPKIADFGLAKQLRGETPAGRTPSGVVMGTPSYMAPEQATGAAGAVGPAVDVYALGAVLYELLTGRPPFLDKSAWDVIQRLMTEDPVPPRLLQPKVPRDLETICLKCLQKEPRQRYASAQALADDLGRFLASEPIRARPVGAGERAVKWARRRPVAAALVAVSALLAVSLLAAGLLYAKYEHQARRVAEDDLRQLRLLEGTRGDVQRALFQAEKHLEAGDLPRAGEEIASAQGMIHSQPKLADFQPQVDRMRAEWGQRSEALRARGQARAAWPRRFQSWRDEAFYHATRFTGLDQPANLAATCRAARRALGEFGLDPDGPPSSVLDGPHFTADEREEIVADCYQLLLILAEAVAQQPDGGGVAEAVRILRHAQSLRPPTRAFHLRHAHYLGRLGDARGRAEALRLAAQVAPADAVDHFLLGDEHYQRGDLERAIRHFEQAASLRPGHFWAQYLLAICYFRSQRPELAEPWLTFCEKQRPDLDRVYVLRGFVRGELAHRALAEAATAAAALRPAEAARRREEAEAQFAAAESDFATALRLNPRDEEAVYTLLVNRGTTRYRHGRWDEAVADLREAIGKRPRQPMAYQVLADVHRERRQWQEALDLLGRALDLGPNRAGLYHARGRVYLERADLARGLADLEADREPAPLRPEDLTRALADFEEAVRRYGPDPQAATERASLADAHTQRGRILHYRQRYEDARRAYDAALAVQPDHALARRSRGAVLVKLAAYPEAVADFDHYLRRWPDADVYEARGLARLARKEFDLAVADYAQALALAPTSARHALRGWAHLLREAPRSALRDFEDAVRLDPKNGDAHNGRAYALVLAGRYQDGVAAAEQALRLAAAAPAAAPWKESSRTLYNAARVFAQAALRAEAEATRGGLPPPPAVTAYQERALDLLSKALEERPPEERARFWKELVLEDTALTPVRRLWAFERLSARYTGRKQ